MKTAPIFLLVSVQLFTLSVSWAQTTQSGTPKAKDPTIVVTPTVPVSPVKDQTTSGNLKHQETASKAASAAKRNEAQRTALANARISAWEGLKEAEIADASANENTTEDAKKAITSEKLETTPSKKISSASPSSTGKYAKSKRSKRPEKVQSVLKKKQPQPVVSKPRQKLVLPKQTKTIYKKTSTPISVKHRPQKKSTVKATKLAPRKSTKVFSSTTKKVNPKSGKKINHSRSKGNRAPSKHE